MIQDEGYAVQSFQSGQTNSDITPVELVSPLNQYQQMSEQICASDFILSQNAYGGDTIMTPVRSGDTGDHKEAFQFIGSTNSGTINTSGIEAEAVDQALMQPRLLSLNDYQDNA